MKYYLFTYEACGAFIEKGKDSVVFRCIYLCKKTRNGFKTLAEKVTRQNEKTLRNPLWVRPATTGGLHKNLYPQQGEHIKEITKSEATAIMLTATRNKNHA